jgi:hypothetical protein
MKPVKKTSPPPPEGLPVERLALIGGIGLGVVLLIWGAALLLKPKPQPAPPPAAAPAPAPAALAVEETPAPETPAGVFPPAEQPVAPVAPVQTARPSNAPAPPLPPLTDGGAPPMPKGNKP